MGLALLEQTVITEVRVAVRQQLQQVELEIHRLYLQHKEQTVVMAAAAQQILVLVAVVVHLLLEQREQLLAVATAVMELRLLSLVHP
jgi:hypothetical protein